MQALFLGKREFKAGDGTPLTEIFILDVEDEMFGQFTMKSAEFKLMNFEDPSTRDLYEIDTEQTKSGFNTKTTIKNARLSGSKAKITID